MCIRDRCGTEHNSYNTLESIRFMLPNGHVYESGRHGESERFQYSEPNLFKVILKIKNKETFAIVGESGSGKSTIGRILLGLTDKTGGEIFFDGNPLQIHNQKNSIPLRRRLQIVFQDPTASFDPRLRILDSLFEFLELRQGINSEEKLNLAKELVMEVGLDHEMIYRKPSEMSGGQLQRLNIARALASNPDLIFLDEPTSSLDVSIRGQIVNLLLEKQEKFGITFLLVAHDLRVVAVMADLVAAVSYTHLTLPTSDLV